MAAADKLILDADFALLGSADLEGSFEAVLLVGALLGLDAYDDGRQKGIGVLIGSVHGWSNDST